MTHYTILRICPGMFGTQLPKTYAAMGSVKKNTKRKQKTKNLRGQALPAKNSVVNRARASANFARMRPGQTNVDKRCFVFCTHPEAKLKPNRSTRWREIGKLGTELLGSRTLPCTHTASAARTTCRRVDEFGSHRGASVDAHVRPERKKVGPQGPCTYSIHHQRMRSMCHTLR